MSDRKESKIKYINLHNHSTLSTFDGFSYPKEFLESAWESGQDALAMTEHGNMNSLAHHYLASEEMNKNGKKIKPIFGIEAYFLPSIEEWKKQFEKEEENKDKEEDSNVILEDDQALKKGVTKSKRGKRTHLLLLAKSLTGLKNLFKLVSQSYTSECYYYYPRLDREMLRLHSDGLIATNACAGGIYAQIYHQHKNKGQDLVIEKLRDETNRMLNIFGENWFGELQWNDLPDQHVLNQYVIQLSQEFGFKLISTTDSHYPRKELWKERELYKRLGWIGKAGNKRPDWFNKLPESLDEIGFELYPKNGDEIWESFERYSKRQHIEYDKELVLKSIENTYDIAFNLIEDFKPDTSVKLPSFVVPKDKTPESCLTRLCVDELKRRGLDSKTVYLERLKKELLTIKSRGFSQYFLAMKSIVDKAKETQLIGTSRGSAGGSLVSYLLDIIQLDPLKWGTQFERFLLKKTDDNSYPDIDVDFQDPVALKETFKNEWGEYSVIQISNFNTLQIKSLVKDISKFYDIPFEEVNDVTTKMVWEATSLAKAEHKITAGVYNPTFEEFKKYSSTFIGFLQKYPMVGEHIEKLHGQIRSYSAHASGTLIAENLNEHMPLIKVGDKIQSPWVEGQANRHLEPLGFIKMDILGLSSLQMISNCVEFILKRTIEKLTFNDIKEFYNKNLHPDIINFNDQKVWQWVFEEGRFVGVFQFTGRSAQEFCKKVKPKNILELSDITAIERPGPLESNVDVEYLAVRNGEKKVVYLCKEMEEVLERTSGCIYQEQIAELVYKLGKGLTLEDGNKFRKLVVKRGLVGDKQKEKDKIIKKFKEGCLEKGLTEQNASDLLKSLESFAKYGFNFSHSLAYAMISYQCAYLLTYYPVEWCAAFLNKNIDGDDLEHAISLVKSLGFTIKPIDINKSDVTWQIEDEKTLIQPFLSIKNLGQVAIQQIINNRPFANIESLLFNDNILYSKLNKRALHSLVLSGALNCLIDNRFNHLKHFYLSCVQDRPKTAKQMLENIEKYKNEKDFTNEERIDFITNLTGVYPLELVINDKLLTRLNKEKIPPISSYDPITKICWCIPKSLEVKRTKNNKPYFQIQVVDNTFTVKIIRCWGIMNQDQVFLNRPYMVRLDYSEQWGYSSRGCISKYWKLLG